MADLGPRSEDKVAYFQAITGIEDPDLCSQILSAHNWDLQLAISSISSPTAPSVTDPNPDSSEPLIPRPAAAPAPPPPAPGLVWRVVTLPFSLAYSTLSLSARVASGALSLLIPAPSADPALSEAAAFIASFRRDFPDAASTSPNFVAEGFMDALQRSQREFKLLFVYLHSPDHPDVPEFCERCLCSEAVAAFVNENFVSWGGSVRGSEGFRMSNSLKASRYPFCAVVMSSTNQRIAILQQIEGLKSPEEIIAMLQRVVEEYAPLLVTARLEAEERRNNIRLREEQDAAYRAALEADQARERQRKEEQERLEREAAEAERKRKEEEEAQERAAREAAEREAALAKRREEKAMSLGVEPEKGPDVTRVLIRFPNGERKERRFHCSAAIKSLYDYVDSLDCLNAENYCLVSSFPRVSYGPEKYSQTLQETGLHPQASLFVEVES
ncbi:FAS-associated factor 2 protein [Dioscorea alata]|uniref:FAS-associated factor 2 protein n=1 Tax=Dioscorea alata TaxID=55571 RepID=A0ACB7WGH5_DIOAL|nr:FAS-associated factor 2 protein [Dioscorea alata]